MFELYINDNLMDLPESGLEISFEYAIMKVDNIGERSGAKSYEFSLPKSGVNLKAIESCNLPNNTGTFPYTKLKARAYQDGVDLNIRFAELLSVNNTINFRLYGGNSDFYQAIQDVKLIDLDLRDLNHFWDDYNIVTRLLNETGYVYPIIEYSVNKIKDETEQKTDPVKTWRMYLSLFYEEILSRFFQHVGYELVNEMAGTYSHKLLLPYSGADYVRNSDGRRYQIKVGRTSSYAVNTFFGDNYYVKWNKLFEETDYFKFANHNWRADLANGTRNYGTCIELADRCKLSGTLRLSIRNEGLSFMKFRISVFTKRGFDKFSPAEDGAYSEITLGAINTPTQKGTVTINFQNLITENDEGFDFIAVEVTQETGNTTLPVNFRVEADSYLEITDCQIITPREITFNSYEEKTFLGKDVDVLDRAAKRDYGFPGIFDNASTYNRNFITVNSIFGDLSFVDMLKDYCLLFNLIPVVDNQRQRVRLVKFDNVRKNISGAKDWTDKLDLTTKEDLRFMDDTYARNNKLAWTIDQYKDEDLEFDIIEEPLGSNTYIEVENENLEFEKTIVELNSAATITCTKFDKTLSHIPVVGNNDEVGAKTQRILFQDVVLIQNFTGVPIRIQKIMDDPEDSTEVRYFSNTYFAPALCFETLKPLYYPIIEKVIQNFKKLRVLVKLNSVDVNQIDFSAPVYLQQFEAYFYISKIEDYKVDGGSCMVELVKLNING